MLLIITLSKQKYICDVKLLFDVLNKPGYINEKKNLF